MDEQQEPIFAYLSDPASFGGASVKRIDTHAAVIFLAGASAYKVKRAVRFPFLDYSTLEKRKEACEAELRINRPLAAEIYIGVVPIMREPDGRLAIGGGGVPIEWAVQMHRFDESATLDHLAAAGRIDSSLADALARAVIAAQGAWASATAEAEETKAEETKAEERKADETKAEETVAPLRWINALADYVEEHVAAFLQAPELFPPAEVEAFAVASRAAYGRIHALLCERGRRGFVQRIHGDLHLGNIVLLDGRPVLFDAIEFSPLIASGDVLYDLAFLLMDLSGRGLEPAANIVLNRYLTERQRGEDLDALAALPFFLSMRAAIRAKVTAARLAFEDAEDRDGIEQRAREYFRMARRFIEPSAPVLVAIGGLSGTGKSVLSRALAPDINPVPGALVLRSDIERKALLGRKESEKLSDEAYAEAITARVFATLADKARRALIAGHSVVVDAVFSKPDERELIEQSAAVLGVAFSGLFLEADLATRLARVDARTHDVSDADARVAQQQESYDLGSVRWTRIDACGTPDTTLDRARAARAIGSLKDKLRIKGEILSTGIKWDAER
jgi:aminoglycoside phosphotransferase family enzyme/predicted kinase